MNKGTIASILDRKTLQPKDNDKWNLEIEFELEEVRERKRGFFYYDNSTKVRITSSVEVIEEGLDGVKIYSENSVYDIKYNN
jgi:hypothetical protein